MKTMPYGVIETLPVARFFYQGKSHTHPVRRTVLIIEDRPDEFVGYELRSGRKVFSFHEVIEKKVVKTYKKAKIARFGDYCRLRLRKDAPNPLQTTLRRYDLLDLMLKGA